MGRVASGSSTLGPFQWCKQPFSVHVQPRNSGCKLLCRAGVFVFYSNGCDMKGIQLGY